MRSLIVFLVLLYSNSTIANDVIVTETHATKHNQCVDGFIDLEITGGFAPYSVKYERLIEHPTFGLFWITVKEENDISGDDGNEDLEDAAEGKYRITITDFHCGELVTNAEIECECTPCNILSNVINPSCLGDDGGSISIEMDCDEQGPFQARWNDKGTGFERNSLTPGRYCVTVLDSSGECETTQCWGLTVGRSFMVNLVNKNNVSFCGDESSCDGSLLVEVSGGAPPYQYAWSNGSAGLSATGLCVGTHNVTVADSDGCEIVESFELCCCEPGEGGNGGLGEDGACSINPLSMEFSVNGLPNGSVNISLSGGGGSIACNWSGPSGYTDLGCAGISNINEEGEYCFTATDGCSRLSKCFTVVDCSNSDLEVFGNASPTCPDLNAGIIDISATGGNSPYFVQWSNGQTALSLEDLFAGDYCVTVTDNTFCTAEACFTVESNAEVTDIISTLDPCVNISVCNGVEVVTDQANYVQTHIDGLCVVERVCPINGETDIVTLNSILLKTFNCTRTYKCADGTEEMLVGVSSNDPTVKKDPLGTCTTMYRCYNESCVYVDPATGLSETYVNDNAVPGSCPDIFHDPCNTECGPNMRMAHYRCGIDIVLSKCVPCVNDGIIKDSLDFLSRTILSSESFQSVEKQEFTEILKALNFRIAPNPILNSSVLVIQSDENVYSNLDLVIELYDTKGVLLSDENVFLNKGSNRIQLNIQGLNNGLYFVKIKSKFSSGEVIRKAVILK